MRQNELCAGASEKVILSRFGGKKYKNNNALFVLMENNIGGMLVTC